MLNDIDLLTAPASSVLREVAGLEPGPMMMSLLLSVDARALEPDDALTYLELHEQVSSWWASIGVQPMVAVGSPAPTVDETILWSTDTGSEEMKSIRIQDARREEIAAALRIAPSTAQDRLDTARLLTGPLARTWELLHAGAISPGHVRVVVDVISRLPGATTVLQGDPADDGPQEEADRRRFAKACDALQDRVLPIAARGTLSMTRAAVKRAILAIDAEGERRRRERARCTRDVYVLDELDGLSTLIARMSTESAHAVLAEVNALAHDGRLVSECAATIGERRSEALAALVLERRSAAPGDDSPNTAPDDEGSEPRLRAHLDIVIDLPTLLSLQSAMSGTADVSGAGPVVSDVVLDLLADPGVTLTMRRLVSDPITGHLLDRGRRTYEIPDALREFIVTRDRTCRFPGCRRRASDCQIDHATAWQDGGPTDVANLGALCVRHHQLKTLGGWDLTGCSADGSGTWTSPLGRTYRHDPEPLPGPPPPAPPSGPPPGLPPPEPPPPF